LLSVVVPVWKQMDAPDRTLPIEDLEQPEETRRAVLALAAAVFEE
jgi:hypothetical protein